MGCGCCVRETTRERERKREKRCFFYPEDAFLSKKAALDSKKKAGAMATNLAARLPPLAGAGWCRVYLCRHSRTLWNTQDIVHGRGDVPIDPVGEGGRREE
eukprot:Rhum_TRINITY_DN12763_c0_g1::Rhum_TRINITY_DN12763_c0_g1_i1::g.54228::m.54228